MKIIDQQIKYDLKTCYLYTKFSDGSIKGEPLTAEEAALFQAQHGY